MVALILGQGSFSCTKCKIGQIRVALKISIYRTNILNTSSIIQHTVDMKQVYLVDSNDVGQK